MLYTNADSIDTYVSVYFSISTANVLARYRNVDALG